MTTIDWGTFPTWVSSLGTTGALWVGAVTLRRAQNKERSTEADAVKCDWKRRDCCGYKALQGWTADVSNGGPRPIYNVYAITFDSSTGIMGEGRQIANVLQPGTADHVHVSGGSPEWSRPYAILFRDTEGTWWLRDILEQSLYRRSRIPGTGRVRHTMRRLRKEGRLTPPQLLQRGGNGHRAPW
ncbi:hypothetical protein ACIGW4_33370 [Streptomyces sp. NPDC053513]|uniref:hypothetical protein n=1 Tax=unclassified Streptomyces TaxID=2593676 RepID=UPI0037D41DBB